MAASMNMHNSGSHKSQKLAGKPKPPQRMSIEVQDGQLRKPDAVEGESSLPQEPHPLLQLVPVFSACELLTFHTPPAPVWGCSTDPQRF